MTSLAVTLLRRGDLSDPESAQMTHRLRIADGLLSSVGVLRERLHTQDDDCVFNHNSVKMKFCPNCKMTPLPDWVTDDVLQSLYNAADSARAKFNREREE